MMKGFPTNIAGRNIAPFAKTWVAHITHNTPDFRKYKSNGTQKKNFSGKKTNASSSGPKRPN